MKLRVAFDLARAGNFPSVASNVLAALVLARRGEPRWPDWGMFALCVLAGCLTYAGGATLNDVADAGFDSRNKPERPIPAGMISRRKAAALGALEMLAGLGLLVFAGAEPPWVASLGATILAYDWIHKRWIGSVILMAGCRVLLAGALATSLQYVTPAFLPWVAALFVYIVVLSLIARWEYQPGAPAAKIGRSVGRLLAFIPLIDAVALFWVGAWIPAVACAAAVPLGRWAQRLAAAT